MIGWSWIRIRLLLTHKHNIHQENIIPQQRSAGLTQTLIQSKKNNQLTFIYLLSVSSRNFTPESVLLFFRESSSSSSSHLSFKFQGYQNISNANNFVIWIININFYDRFFYLKSLTNKKYNSWDLKIYSWRYVCFQCFWSSSDADGWKFVSFNLHSRMSQHLICMMQKWRISQKTLSVSRRLETLVVVALFTCKIVWNCWEKKMS